MYTKNETTQKIRFSSPVSPEANSRRLLNPRRVSLVPKKRRAAPPRFGRRARQFWHPVLANRSDRTQPFSRVDLSDSLRASAMLSDLSTPRKPIKTNYMRKTRNQKKTVFELQQKIRRSYHPNSPLPKLSLHPPHRPFKIDSPASIPNHHRLKPSLPGIHRREPDAKIIS